MCQNINPGRSSRQRDLIDDIEEDEDKIEEAFIKLSERAIVQLIEDEPDIYSIDDVKIRYK